VEQELAGKMEKRRARVKKLSGLERGALACFLVLFLTSVGMVTYYSIVSISNPEVDFMDGLFWQFMLTSLISMMAGFLYGVNRS